MAGRKVRNAALAFLPLLLGAGCGTTGLQDFNFRVDHRLQFLSPPDRALVGAPLRVEWRMSGFAVQAEGSAPPQRDAGYFAVFVDRAPIRPDQTMRSVASRDPQCLHTPGCPDPAYLQQRQIYLTTSPSVTLEQIPPLAGDDESIQLHTITVVLMDTAGHRIGESAWEVDVRIRKVGL